jgi:multidrug efflux pump subunit AcrA (membrane-fusion protein)
MLNISHNPINKKVTLSGYASHEKAFHRKHYTYLNRFLKGFSVAVLVILFLPWTQNVTGDGYVTTLTPDQRPQTIQSQIPGRIERWYVREGDLVKKGDTILHISEIKTDYQDPQLIERSRLQRDAKNNSVESYKQKVLALENQIAAVENEWKLKLAQAKNKLEQSHLKVKSDSIDLIAAETNYKIAEVQYNRSLTLQKEGLKPMTDVEQKNIQLQGSQAKMISQKNKLMASKNDVINAEIEINRISAEYSDKLAKVQGDKFTALSNQFEAEVETSKLDNTTSNYEIRKSLYYVTAPVDGYVNKAIRAGIGETFKEGESLVGIMPVNYDLAVETFVEPLDLPLIHKGESVRIQFDGWPAIFFSGWPNASYGTFAGKIVAVETFISNNGKFRVLVAPDPEQKEWPKNVRVGSGAYTISLLDDVPIWYEVWRRLNGFPPNYYNPAATTQKDQ